MPILSHGSLGGQHFLQPLGKGTRKKVVPRIVLPKVKQSHAFLSAACHCTVTVAGQSLEFTLPPATPPPRGERNNKPLWSAGDHGAPVAHFTFTSPVSN